MDEGGIGGTGVGSDRDDGGIGGTGVSAAVESGVIGTITGFGSICVGEIEVHYDHETPIEIDGEAANASALAIGQVVEVIATGSGSEVRAQRIASQHILVGPITAADRGDGTLSVLGQAVVLTPATRLDVDADGAPLKLDLHTTVRVSGMRRADGMIVASRLGAGTANDRVQLSGPVSRTDPAALAVGGLAVRGEAAAVSSIPEVGGEVRVVGRWDGQGIVADAVQPLPSVPFGGRVAHIDLEGFVRPAAATGGFYLGPFLVQVPAAVGVPSASSFGENGGRLRVQATVRDQHLVADRFVPTFDLRPAAVSERPRGPVPPGHVVGEAREGERRPGREGPPPAHEVPGGWRPAPGPRDANTDRQGGFDRAAPPPPRPESRQYDAPERPILEHPVGDRPLRPEMPPRPEAPPRPELPPRPDVPPRPDLPPRPEVPPRPEPPPRPERPDRHVPLG